ncbi:MULTISPECIES: methylenetetrahydrofolate reductase [NAD(P)H] [Deefgea]|uniref:Methylenetetrahydrofolate reductase n=1 Tax=Deefgea piscis TaxID=2739061 RepID=A0A6M8SRH4_9NEIS|nr:MULTISPECIES: methylenetetrahydrofolate reductase [NAD(P)H] [Deefgea]MBM5574765.1 methylenetetrahydrofolate reductase [NAD(P)H] [Deefgea sp. CFH1-16]QKJ66734.1 methylenetetrahydrofolate reductase [NAD(P)H] [Deefgea piscis]
MTNPLRPISFEFFPPKTDEGAAKLATTRRQLAQFNPEFFSVTFGAGGTTQEGTLRAVVDIQAAGHAAAPHLSCIGSTKDNIRQVVQQYKNHGIKHIVALRGDIPSGMGEFGEFRYANELVSFLRSEFGDWFHIEVAAYPEFHPQSPSAEADLRHFINKVNAGADSAITQYFFNADAYFRFVDEVQARGVSIPIVPGIMPIQNYSQLQRFSDMCGAEIPRWLRLRLQAYSDDTASIRAFGLDFVTELSDRLLAGGAPGLHFYTLNAAGAVSTVCQRLGY